MKSHYEVLGVQPDATPEQIKAMYRRKAMLHPPDRNADGYDPKAMVDIQLAYDVLSDPEKRKRYDETGHRRAGRRVHRLSVRRRADSHVE